MHAYRAVFNSLFGLGLELGLALGLTLATACGDNEEPPFPDDDSVLGQQLERVRAATAKYHDVSVAEADGFVSEGTCVFHPVLGTMGIHYAHFPRLDDPAVDIEEPEALVYLPERGRMQLVAIEYVQLIVIDGVPYLGCGVENDSCPPPNPPPAPSIFEGIVFDGPMPGHVEGMPWHYDQHVWLWEPNPAGLFAPYNPALWCE